MIRTRSLGNGTWRLPVAAVLLQQIVLQAPVHANSGQVIAQEVENFRCLVPSMGQGKGDWIQFHNRKGKATGIPSAEMKVIASGTIDRVPAAAAFVTWNTGGSGQWTTLLLFKRLHGKISEVGYFCDYVHSTDKLQIKQNKIFVHLNDNEELAMFKTDNRVKIESGGYISIGADGFERNDKQK